jgi:hypothetical protein
MIVLNVGQLKHVKQYLTSKHYINYTIFNNISDIFIVMESFSEKIRVTRKNILIAENFIVRKTESAEKTKKIDFMRLNQVHLARQ